ncbi:MAG: glycoside hydrolase family 38 C-terminal domain-containing protein [Opitutaceae bacterium]|nr:glycoside hydrolase family 38 C-terminal domain-containing protein [Opitutaceae bacterium]
MSATAAEQAAEGPAAVVAKPDFCMFLANHWTYSDIGWSYGLKSCVQSVTDSLDMADYAPSVKTGINLDAAAFPLMAAANPEVIERLKRYLAEGKVEIIGGTYGQPMGSMVSGESNIRQLVAGQQTIRQTLGVTVSAFLEEEEFTHPQMPQLLKGAGYRYASAAQCNTWGKHGSPPLDLNVFQWQGLDGTCILVAPINGLVFHPPVVTHDIEWLWSPEGRRRVEELGRLGMPLAIKWVEFGWGPDELEGKTANKFFAAKFRELTAKYNVQYTTLTEYLDRYGAQAKERIQWRMDDFHKLEPWGCGGDQLRREEREVEAVLTAAERFDAAASLLGLTQGREAELDTAWEHLLTAQGHGVSLCEYLDDGLDYNGINDPAARQFLAATGSAEENAKVKSWGDMGFRYLAVAKQTGHAILESALHAIGAAVDTAAMSRGQTAAIVFNPGGSGRDAIVTARGVPLPAGAGARVVVRDADGRPVPSQVLAAERSGEAATADVLFQAHELPPFGYATYYLDQVKPDPVAPASDLRTSDTGWRLENACVSVELDPVNGAITHLVDRRSGLDLIDGKQRAFPIFSGRPNRKDPFGKDAPEEYDSAPSQAEISWVERGPVRAVVRVAHTWPQMRLEYWITLHSGSPEVDVRIRVAADVPPETLQERVNVWQPPLHIPDGYWFSFASAFQPTAVIRDFPFGVEPCGKDAIDALNFVDLVGPQGGLLLVHSGTQYFKRSGDVVFSNLAMREWHGIFMKKPGWPRLAEYRFALVPHGPDFTNADRLRCVENFDQSPICVLEALHVGRLARQRRFVSLDSAGLLLSAFRGVGQGAYEARVVEQEGRPASGQLSFDLPVGRYAPCDLLGKTLAPLQPPAQGAIPLSLTSWQIRTLWIEADSKSRGN